MKGYLLDTNAWIALLKNHAAVVEGVRRAGCTLSVFARVVRTMVWGLQKPADC